MPLSLTAILPPIHFYSTTTKADLELELMKRDERIAELRHALTMLDKDHDSLRTDADAKDETIARLQQQIEEQVRDQVLQNTVMSSCFKPH